MPGYAVGAMGGVNAEPHEFGLQPKPPFPAIDLAIHGGGCCRHGLSFGIDPHWKWQRQSALPRMRNLTMLAIYPGLQCGIHRAQEIAAVIARVKVEQITR